MKKAHPRAVLLDGLAEEETVIPVGVWLVDVTPGHLGQPTLSMFRVLEVWKAVVVIEDEDRVKRTVNRMVLEHDMESGDVIRTRDFKEEGR